MEGDEVSARFRWSTANEKPSCACKENDEAPFSQSDALKMLPQTEKAGGAARTQQHLIFPVSLQGWNVE